MRFERFGVMELVLLVSGNGELHVEKMGIVMIWFGYKLDLVLTVIVCEI